MSLNGQVELNKTVEAPVEEGQPSCPSGWEPRTAVTTPGETGSARFVDEALGFLVQYPVDKEGQPEYPVGAGESTK